MKAISFSDALAQGLTPGWTLGNEDGFFSNSRLGVELRRIAVMRDGRLLYDQFVVVEPVGAATLPVDPYEQVGLVQVWRPVAEIGQPARTGGDFDLSTIGQLEWEIPRGFPILGSDSAEPSDVTAIREAEEETGRRVYDARLLGYYRGNSTFFVNAIPIWCAKLTGEGSMRPGDPNEKILRSTVFERREVARMILAGEISDGFTLAALTLYDARCDAGLI